jgi:adenosine deaminase
MPKLMAVVQTELHRHLDVSLRLTTLLELAQAGGHEATSTSLEAFGSKIQLKSPLKSLDSVIGTFALFQKVFSRPEICERVAFEAVEDAYREGTRKIEYRFSPSFVCDESGMSWDEALAGFERGRDRALATYRDIKVGFICIATREFGEELVAKTVDFFLANRSRFVGIDLAGKEANYPCRLFERAFKKARDVDANITIHAGEAAGPENVWEAIDLLGAKRIGHGIESMKDAKLLEALRQRGICLEVCPTSNWLTGATPSLEKHPLPQLLRAGVPVSINTDDPSVFAVTLPGEMAVSVKKMGLTEAELALCQRNASDASFIK